MKSTLKKSMKLNRIILTSVAILVSIPSCHKEIKKISDTKEVVSVNTIEGLFDMMDRMIMDKVPDSSAFVHVKSRIPFPDGQDWDAEYLGYVIGEDSLYYTFLDCSAQKIKIEKKYASIIPSSLKEVANKALEWKGVFEDRWRPVRHHAGYEIVPIYVISVWCYKNNLKAEAKRLIKEVSNYKELTEMLDFMFGSLYYNEMLHAFSFERDYKKAILFAEHLDKPEFGDYEYKNDAVQLGEQLKKRSEDFISLKLPSLKEWDSLKACLTRPDRIKYLCNRLRLLNCIQFYQPGGISLSSKQYSVPSTTFDKSRQALANWPIYHEGEELPQYEVINPYDELLKMSLTPADVKLIVPYLEDNDYIVAFSFHRDFKSERYLHKVNSVISDIILKSIGKSFVDLRNFDSLDEKTKRQEIRKIKRWCTQNGKLTGEDLAIQTLNRTKIWSEFETVMGKCLENKYVKALPILFRRVNDFDVPFEPELKGKIAKTIFNFGQNKLVTINMLRGLEANNDYWVKQWASLYVIRYEPQYISEGLSNLKVVLDSCQGTIWYPSSIGILLESKNDYAFYLAEGILEKPVFQQQFDWPYYSEQLKSLFLSGSDKAYEFILKGLNSVTKEQGYFTDSREILVCDRYMSMVNEWKGIDDDDHYSLSVEGYRLKSKEMSAWVNEQFMLVKAGKDSAIKRNIGNEPVWTLDAPAGR
jgi:hypothetical protein